MNWLDLLIALLLVYFVLKGLKRGLVREALGLVGVVIAFVVATVKMNNGVSLISKYVSIPSQVATAISFIFIFVAVLLIFWIVAELVRGLLSVSFLGWVDKLGGVILGLFKGSLIASLILLFIPLLPLPLDFSAQMEKSILAGPTRKIAPAMFDFFKSKFPQAKLFYDEFRESLGKDLPLGQSNGR